MCVTVNSFNPTLSLFTGTLFLIVLKVTCKPETRGFFFFFNVSVQNMICSFIVEFVFNFFLSLEVWIEVRRTTFIIKLPHSAHFSISNKTFKNHTSLRAFSNIKKDLFSKVAKFV